MIVVTGAAGFIGSHMIKKLNDHRFTNIIAVDKFDNELKNQNLFDCKLTASIDREVFFDWLDLNCEEVEFIFHLGARTDTSETDEKLLDVLNTSYTKSIWERCCKHQIPLIYASSAATYGDGSDGFSDDLEILKKLKPLNAYAKSKHVFDLWALKQESKPFYWAGLKFFNVYGSNEEHKGKMASMIHQSEKQIRETGKLKLFKSHRPDFQDGEQKRDFIDVGDVVSVMYWMMHHRKNSGIYNVGTGSAETFNELAKVTFSSLNIPESIEYIDIPGSIRSTYQYKTEADITSLRKIGYDKKMKSLKEGIQAKVKSD